MQHYQTDEFSVTDIRHTINEAWRVICTRRWFLLFPFCIVATLACAASLLIPRKYELKTVIKREHDPVFAKMMGRSWTEPYEDIRNRMRSEIKDASFIESVLTPEELPSGSGAFDDGTLTPSGRGARLALVEKIVEGLSVSTSEASTHRDIVEISLITENPHGMADILARIRDSYVRQARVRTVQILDKVKRFLTNESQRCREELNTLRRQIIEYELKHPGIDPAVPAPSGAEMTALTIERVDLERRQDNAELDRQRWEVELSRLIGRDHEAQESGEGAMLEEPNPRYAQLLDEIDELETKIAEGKSVRMMTDEHPEIQRNRTLLEQRRSALAQMPRTLRVSARVVGARAANLDAAEQLKRKLADNAAAAEVIKCRLAEIEGRSMEINRQRALALEHREPYLKLRGDAERLSAELRDWQQSITPIQQVLHLEDNNHSIHFATVQDVSPDAAPVSPDPRLVLLICIGLGAAAAVLSVLTVELVDRSYRSAKQLAASVGVPVIESIDEIITKALHRRRLFRRIVVMPILAALSVSTVFAACTLAYVRLKSPGDAEWQSLSPREALSFVMDAGE